MIDWKHGGNTVRDHGRNVDGNAGRSHESFNLIFSRIFLVLLCLLMLHAGINPAIAQESETDGTCSVEGGSHIVLLEEPYYHDFQDRIVAFLDELCHS